MAAKSRQSVTLSRYFLEPANVNQRRYEALRAYFVEGLPSAEAAKRFGYTPGSFRVLTHQFRRDPTREFFLPSPREARPHGKQNRLRDKVVALRKQNLSIYDISRAVSREDETISPAAVAKILRAEGFAKLPRRLDEERPESPRPTIAHVADVRQLDLAPRQFRTRFGGLFLFVAWLASCRLDAMLRRAGLPGTEMVPAGCAMRSLLALKLYGNARHSHVMSHVLDEGLALFAGLNVIPKRSFLTEYSCRVEPSCYPKLMRAWFDAVGKLGLEWGASFDLDFHTIPFHGKAVVSAQVTALNTAAEIGWGYANAAHTQRYNREPLSQWLTPSLLKTSDPVVQFVEFFGTTYRQWVWCRSHVVVRVEFHRCGFGSYITYRDDYRFESSPGRLPILKNTYTYDPQSMFCRNHMFACAANFVGSGDCDDVNDCLAFLAGEGKKFNVTVEYHTTRAYYPGVPV